MSIFVTIKSRLGSPSMPPKSLNNIKKKLAMGSSKFAVKLCLTALFCLLSSCSAEWHLKRAVKKNPMIVKTDTLKVRDTFYTPAVYVTDTFVTEQYDTIEIIKDKLQIKIVKSNDTIRVTGACKSDTIVRTVSVPVERVVYKEAKKSKLFEHLSSAVWGFASVLLLVIIYRSERR